LTVGAVTGLMAVRKRKTLDSEGCVDSNCPESMASDVDSYNSLRTFSSIGFGAGVALAGAGAVLLLTAPSSPRADKATLHPWVGLGSAGLLGQF
jgi:hypothetical protein